MSQLRLNTELGSSLIVVPGSMQDLTAYSSPEKTILLVDENVFRHHATRLEKYRIIQVPEGEKSKSLESYGNVFGKMLEAGVDRTWKLVAVGGGITTDLGGFVASSYFRGIEFGFVSTTLLGQVDAAIGGKNGINYKGYKNLIGIIRQPSFVLNDLESLETLPEKEFTGGFAEIIKYGFIRNQAIYSFLEENLEKAKAKDMPVLEKLVYDSALVKINIVESDVSEKGDRKLLNFGHTFAHAIEKLAGWSHGEAVSAGMVLAGKLSVNLGFCNAGNFDKLYNILERTGLPVNINISGPELVEAMQKDKKKAGDRMHLILLRDIGNAFVHEVKITNLISMVNDLY